MAAGNPQAELAAAQAEVEAIDNKIVVKQAEAEAVKDKNLRATFRLEVQSLERQKLAAARRLKTAQVKLRKAELVATAIPEDDWAEHIDPNTGSVFYFNAKTGESSWAKPQTTAASTSAPSKAEPPAAEQKTEDWTEHIDPQSGRTFYYNAATGATSWDKPAQPSQEGASVKHGAADVLQQNWTEHIDPGSGNTFYYNASTGETSWTKPGNAVREREAQLVATDSLSDWTENIDPSTGQKFYFNVRTNESSWTMPSSAFGQSLQHVHPIAVAAA